jgi:hypothetical protein
VSRQPGGAREAGCPGCGATLTFKSAATLLVVCPYCDSASWRRDVNLELLGKVAHVADVDSILALGARGMRERVDWTVVGQVQLDHGAGPWNEWALALSDGGTAWIAEAQGELLLSREVEPPAGPERSALKAGRKTSFAGRSWVVAEVGVGKVTAARGELPSELVPGHSYVYADLRGPGGAFATLTYESGEAEAPVLCFTGRVVTREDLGLDPDSVPPREPRRVEARRLACPACGQSFDLRHPDEARRAGCPSCGSVLDVTSPDATVVQEHKRRLKAPRLPLGAEVRLVGLDVEVLAMLVRSVRYAGVRYPWSEYLLRVKGGGYRWLVEAKGHWSLVEPVGLGDVDVAYRRADWRGRSFRHFQENVATVDLVIGEVYWAVAVGDRVESADFVDPPEMLTVESTDDERVVSLGRYLPRAEVQAAFGPGVVLPAPEGVAPHQPNLAAAARGAWWRLTAAVLLAGVALWIWFASTHQRRVVYAASFAWKSESTTTSRPAAPSPTPPAEGAPAPPEPNVWFSEPFELASASANLRLKLDAPGLDNAWIGVDAALVELDTGEVRYAALEAEHWSGVDGGESWSEGDRDAVAWLGEVPAGRYALRLEADVERGSPSPSAYSIPGFSSAAAAASSELWTLEITRQVPSTGRPLLVLLLLSLPAAIVTLRSWLFEKRRWAESDHA